MEVKKFRNKPAEIEAIQFSESSVGEIERWAGDTAYLFIAKSGTHKLIVETLEGSMTASVGDWIIKGANGGFYICDPGAFEATYEAVTA